MTKHKLCLELGCLECRHVPQVVREAIAEIQRRLDTALSPQVIQYPGDQIDKVFQDFERQRSKCGRCDQFWQDRRGYDDHQC